MLDESGIAENKVELLFSHDKLSLASILRLLSSGHWGNVSLTNYYTGTYLGGAVVDLHVDKERGCWGCMHIPTIVDNNKENYDASLCLNGQREREEEGGVGG